MRTPWRVRPRVSWRAIALLAGLLPGATAAAGQEAAKPLLSAEIRAVLERDGAQAAQRRFDEIYPVHKDRFEIDVKGLAELGSEYLQAGDQATAQVILTMTAAIARDMIAEHAQAVPGAEHPPRPDTARRRAAPEPAPRVAAVPDRGPARDDLQRFHGVYGVAVESGARRDLFVTESCDGYLVVGAMWGDAANWWMRSLSDRAFAMANAFQSLQIAFQVGPDGAVESMSHDLEYLRTPLPRVGPLPEGWESCVRRGEGG